MDADSETVAGGNSTRRALARYEHICLA